MFIKIIALPIVIGVLGHRYYNHHGHKTLYDQIKSDLEWSWARVPNLNEL